RRHSRQGRAFIIGRSATFIAVALFEESEWSFVPLFRIGGLHVYVIVDGQSRIVRAGFNASEDNRIPRGFDDFCASADRFEVLPSEHGTPPDVILAVRFHADRW